MNTASRTLMCAVLAATTVQYAGAQQSLTGEFRPRTEYRHGYKSLADTAQDAAFFTSQRSRIHFRHNSEKLRAGFIVQDIRTWGAVSQLNTSDDFLSVHEAWAEMNLTGKLWFKAGRQELVYDDHRILGNVDWTQQARSHDMTLFRYADSAVTIHAGLAFNQDKEQLTTNVYTVTGSYKAMQFLWLHRDIKSTGLSFLFLNNGNQWSENASNGTVSYKTVYSQTAGLRAVLKKKKITAAAAAYYQGGKDGSNRDLAAYYGSAEVTVKAGEKFTLGILYELLSGTSQTDTAGKDNNSFTPLYGTNHKFNGFMDYFFVGNHVNSVGLSDLCFRAKYTAGKFSAAADVHSFSAAADVLDAEKLAQTGTYTAMGRGLGIETDITLGYKLSDEVLIQAGYSQLSGTASLEALRGGDRKDLSNWAWLMITAKPVFLNK